MIFDLQPEVRRGLERVVTAIGFGGWLSTLELRQAMITCLPPDDDLTVARTYLAERGVRVLDASEAEPVGYYRR